VSVDSAVIQAHRAEVDLRRGMRKHEAMAGAGTHIGGHLSKTSHIFGAHKSAERWGGTKILFKVRYVVSFL
jgi:hypothetical protein